MGNFKKHVAIQTFPHFNFFLSFKKSIKAFIDCSENHSDVQKNKLYGCLESTNFEPVLKFMYENLHALSGKSDPQKTDQIKSLFVCLMDVLLTQEIEDPVTKYVSHGVMSHSLPVAKKMGELAEALQMHHNFSEYLVSKKMLKPLSKSQFTAYYQWVGLLHDIGYPLQQHKKLSKSAHAPLGATVFHQKISTHFKEFLQSIDFSSKDAEVLSNLTKHFIFSHNGDVNEVTLQNNSFYVPVSGGKIGLLDNTIKKQEVPFAGIGRLCRCCGFDGRYVDIINYGDKKGVLPFHKLDLKKDKSGLAGLMLADNMSDTRERLSIDQRQLVEDIVAQLPKYLGSNTVRLDLGSDQTVSEYFNLESEFSKKCAIKECGFLLSIYTIRHIDFFIDKNNQKGIFRVVFDKEMSNILNDVCVEKTLVMDIFKNRFKSLCSTMSYDGEPLVFNEVYQ